MPHWRSSRGTGRPARSARDFAQPEFVTPVEEQVRRILFWNAVAAAVLVAWLFGWLPL